MSHNNAYISYKNPEKFKFEFNKIFARKPLKKIKKNVISKFARILASKIIMKFKFPDSDDFAFVSILGFHQLCFLYYAQMFSEDNYLRIISDNKYLYAFQ